jgi:hypothetical protein
MAGKGRAREGRQPRRGPPPKDKGPAGPSKGKKGRTSILIYAAIIFVVIIVLSAVVFVRIVYPPKAEMPRPQIVDGLGTRAGPSDGTLGEAKFTIRNNGTGALDVASLSLSWQGPGAQKTLFLDKGTWSHTSKDSFAVGGFGTPADGWDPAAGRFLVRSPTIAYLVVNLTAQGGIGDPLGPGQVFKVVLTIEGSGPGSGNSDAKNFKVPGSLGQGTNVVLTVVK